MHAPEGTSASGRAARLAGWYLIAAVGWIYVSDRLTENLPISATAYAWLQTLKGFVFVLVTAGILYVLLRRMFTSIDKTQSDLYLTQFVIDHAGDAIFWLTEDARFAYVNEAACQSLEYARQELLTKTLTDIDPEYSRERYEQVWKSLHHFGVLRVETTHRTKTGRGMAVEVTANLIHYKERTLNIAFTRNIEERKAAERRVRETQNRLAAVIDVLPGHVFVKDAEGRYAVTNRRFREDFGLSDDDIAGRTQNDLFDPETARSLSEQDRHVLERGENVYVREQPLLVGGTVRTVAMRKVPLRDERGDVVGLVGLAIDISDRKEMEEMLRATNTALRRANADLEQFAYAAAHDLREPLRTIALYTQVLERSYSGELTAHALRAVHYIFESARRMETLVNDLLAFTQTIAPQTEAPLADADEVGREVVNALGAVISASAAVVEVASLPAVAVERVHLRQVLQNLIANAIRYRHPERPAHILVSAETADAEVVFRVSDNGIGIKPEYHDRIFGLFKRLHGLDVPGNGIGLALCRKIVEHYGGRIWVDSEAGAGATFSFTLPAAGQK
jgi:PAS domain S-box-containing protein